MSEQSSAVSLSEMPRWGGSFSRVHEYSTLDQLENPGGELDEAMFAADALISNWHGNHFAGLYLYGTPGTGKTHYAVGLGRKLAEREDSGVSYLHLPTTDPGSFEKMKSFMQTSLSEREKYRPVTIFGDRQIDKGEDLRRSPGMALILDDYRPEHQQQVYAATEAAAEFGGLVIITSNHPDPFQLTDTPSTNLGYQEIAMQEMASRVNPDAVEKYEAANRKRRDALSASLRSRIAAGFKFIEFTGDDRRLQNSFWN